MKTEKFTIAVDYCGEGYALDDMAITKAEFNRQLAFLRGQVSRSVREWEYPMEEADPQEYDLRAEKVTIYSFRCCFGTTTLTHKVCKEGYRYTTSAERRRAALGQGGK